MAGMTIDELLQLMAEFEVTPDFLVEMQTRLDAADKEFEEDARKSAITSEWLNRRYTI